MFVADENKMQMFKALNRGKDVRQYNHRDLLYSFEI